MEENSVAHVEVASIALHGTFGQGTVPRLQRSVHVNVRWTIWTKENNAKIFYLEFREEGLSSRGPDDEHQQDPSLLSFQ